MLVGIKDGVTVHLVVKSTGKVAASAANKTSVPTVTPNAVSDERNGLRQININLCVIERAI